MLILGLFGMLFILIAFILDEFNQNFNQDTVIYNLLNLIGAGLLMWYAYTLNSIPFMILNVVWFLVAGYKLIKILMK
jgi:hypothetical protein